MSRWTRRRLLGTAAATAAFGCRGGAVVEPADGVTPPGPTSDTGTAPARPPNIVYIYSDQHRAPMLGCYDHPHVLSPNIDALAAEGVLFEQCFTNSPLCRPARATMMTGLMPHVHGCWNNQQIADRSGESHVRLIRDAGWHTAMIGKAHITKINGHPGNPDNVALLEDWGFEHIHELVSQRECANRPNAYSDWLLENTPFGESSKAGRYARYVSNWQQLDSPAPDLPPTSLSTDDHMDVYCGRVAADWITARDDDQPFYLQLNLPGPHNPYDATSEFRNLYDASLLDPPILGPPSEPRSPLVQFLWSAKPELHGLTAEQGRFLRMTYFSKVSLIDEVVGEVMDALVATGRFEDTWIIYASDHGDLLGDHELWGKVAFFEGAIRTPLVVRPPGGVAPWRVRSMVDQMDVTATLLGIADLTGAGEGRSMVSQILDGPSGPDAQRGQDAVVAEISGLPSAEGALKAAMLRDSRYKLVYDLDDDRPVELYDLDADPEERENRVIDPMMQGVASTMRDDLLDRIQS